MTSANSLSKVTGIDETKIFRILEKLKSENQIAKQASRKNSIISIVNYDDYQTSEERFAEQVQNECRTGAEQVQTNKNANNNNNEKNDNNLLVIEEPKKNLPPEKIKGKRKGLDHSPLSTLFKPDDSIQSWLLTGSIEAQKELLEKYSHHVLAEEIKRAFIWQCEKHPRKAGSYLLTWMSNKKTSGYGANQAQKSFKRKGLGVASTELNPTGDPFLQEAIDKGLVG